MEAELLVTKLFVNTGIIDPNAGADVGPKGWEDEDWTSPPAGEAWVFPDKLTLPKGDTVLKPGAGEDVPKPRAEGNTGCEIPDVDWPNGDVEDPSFLLPTAGVETCPGEPVEPNTKAGDVLDCPEAEVETNSEGFVVPDIDDWYAGGGWPKMGVVKQEELLTKKFREGSGLGVCPGLAVEVPPEGLAAWRVNPDCWELARLGPPPAWNKELSAKTQLAHSYLSNTQECTKTPATYESEN